MSSIHAWAFTVERHIKEMVRSCLDDVVAELTTLTAGSKPPVKGMHLDKASDL